MVEMFFRTNPTRIHHSQRMKKSVDLLPIVLLCVALIVSLGSLYAKQNQGKKQENVPMCTDCNVLLVAFDALQAAHVSHLGYPKETTPTIDAIAKDGVTFTNTISAASWTVPSYMSIFTGLYPTEHRVVNKFTVFTPEQKVITNLAKVSPNVRTLAQVYKDHGYVTGGFTGDAGVSSQFGYNQGFDVFKDNDTFGSMEPAATQALTWLKENKGKKFFLFLHGYDMHGQFKLPEGYKGKFMTDSYSGPYKGTAKEQGALREQGLVNPDIGFTQEDTAFWRSWYDSKIFDADQRFAKFWKEFEAMGLKENTIVILFADHGTEFYEHKKVDHGHSLYDELVHVPLVIWAPTIEKNKRIDAQVSTMDIPMTLLELTGVQADTAYQSQIRGRSLVPALKSGSFPAMDVFIETDYRNYTHKRGIRTADGWKYVLTMETGAGELYNLNTDPGETVNLVDTETTRAEELKSKTIAHIKAMGANPEGPWEIGCLPVYGDQCL